MDNYNTQRPALVLREYGRNIQKLVDFVKNTEDKAQRNAYARTLIGLMKQINPTIKDNQENIQKLWDDLFIMADFNIDVESPFPVPERDILVKKPQKVTYKRGDVKYKHYGRNLELLIKQAVELENEEERENAIIYLGRLMKSFHYTWNRDNIEDEIILENIKTLSDGKLSLDAEKVKNERLFEMTHQDRNSRSGSGKKSSNRNYQKRRRRN